MQAKRKTGKVRIRPKAEYIGFIIPFKGGRFQPMTADDSVLVGRKHLKELKENKYIIVEDV